MQINIPHDPSNATPPFEAELNRITVLIGANGSGKSKLLIAIMDRVVRSSGKKNLIRLLPQSQLGDHGFENLPLNEEAKKQLARKINKSANVSEHNRRFHIPEQNILGVLYAIDINEDHKELEEHRAYNKNPNISPKPSVRKSNFDEICGVFNAVTDVTLSFNYRTGHFEVTSKRYDSQSYSIDQLSSGEQWIFRILPAFIEFKDQPMFVFVDEPETALNEQLAVEFWTKIEELRPNWRFVYATHNVSFAARESISDLYLMRSPVMEPRRIDQLAELPKEDKRALLGIGPRLALTKCALFVEGQDQGIDVPFYRALLGRDDIHIISVGGSHDVKQATAQSGYWEILQCEDMELRGCVDRDFTGNHSDLPEHVIALELHDLEAYLCLPALLVKIAGYTAGEMEEDAYIRQIIDHCRSEKETAIFKQVDRLFPFNATISVPKKCRTDLTADSIAKAYITQRDEMLKYAEEKYTDEHIENCVSKIVGKIGKAIAEKDIPKLLTWFSGKPLIEKLCESAELTSKSQAISMIAEHKLVDDVPELLALRTKLTALFPAEENMGVPEKP